MAGKPHTINEFTRHGIGNNQIAIFFYTLLDYVYMKKLNYINDFIDNKSYKLLPEDLNILSKKYNDIGFLLITSKYSDQDPSKLKHNIIYKVLISILNTLF